MGEFMAPVTEGLSAPPETPELPAGDAGELARSAMAEIGAVTDLDGDESSWLEALLRRIFSPITDIFHATENGYDTEILSPAEAAGEATTDTAEGVAAHRVQEAAEEWHVQDGDNSCAVCSQQFIINEFLDLDLTEEELCVIAEEKGWFDPETGTSPSDVGNLLELYGIDTQVNYEGTINDIKATLDQGGRVIVAVDSMALWVDGFGNYPLYGADHAVEVIGIDDSDPLDVRVIINDSGIENGGARSVPYLEFMESWMPSGGFMVSAFPGD